MRNRNPIPNGTRFGRLIVLRQAPVKVRSNGTARQYVCLCDCGTEKIIASASLRAGLTNSCGCMHKEQLANRMTTHGHTKGGGPWPPEYRCWHTMKQRCCNPNNPKYADYGGRGITVCDQWKDSFENFLSDIGTKPSARHSIGRINNDGPYSPENCRWETPAEQSNNTRRNHLVTYNNRTQNLNQWAEETGIPYITLLMRLKRGWGVELALTTPVKVGQKVR